MIKAPLPLPLPRRSFLLVTNGNARLHEACKMLFNHWKHWKHFTSLWKWKEVEHPLPPWYFWSWHRHLHPFPQSKKGVLTPWRNQTFRKCSIVHRGWLQDRSTQGCSCKSRQLSLLLCLKTDVRSDGLERRNRAKGTKRKNWGQFNKETGPYANMRMLISIN